MCAMWRLLAEPLLQQVRLDETWVPFDDYAQAILRSAKAAGLPRSEVTSMGRRYEAWSEGEVDFKQMCQRSKETGKQRPIRESFQQDAAEKPKAELALASERSKPKASQKTQKTMNDLQDSWRAIYSSECTH
eukprot:Skav231580  [mRNA]  locus=scaffold481:257643:258258:- [translate_table: standard]